jgi:hypothetical protein
MFKKNYIPVFLGLFFALVAPVLASAAVSGDQIWTEISDSGLQRGPLNQAKPTAYRTFAMNKGAMLSILGQAPEEFTDAAGTSRAILSLPMPDGTFQRFYIEHSPIVEPGLMEKYPELGATYRAQGIDDPTATGRFDFLPSGFHALVLSASGTVIINPHSKGDTANYITYFKRDSGQSKEGFTCEVGETVLDKALSMNKYDDDNFIPAAATTPAPEVTNGTQLRTYRLALAATQEYTTTVCSPNPAGVACGLAAQVLIMNRVNGVYERDLSIRMNIIANNNLIIYTAEPDPYSNTNPSALLNENQANLDTVIGNANYDIGHVFSTGGGGVATLNGPCTAGTKARGETGLPSPFGDDFAIDFVAHEMGHQFSARHTFNGGTGNCSGGNRTAAAAYEPGSGITIMAYAGICGSQDLAAHSIDTFHVKSLEEIVAYTNTGNGNTCPVTTATGNTPPTPTGPGNFTIPKLTPFSLTASATDPNGDSLTYDWQEYDLGPQTTAIPNTDNPNAMPIFRPYLPTVSGTRVFPSLQYIRNNANVPPSTIGGFLTGELMPQIGGRVMVFQAIVRDNRASGGGINTVTSNVTVDAASGPFNVTAPNTNISAQGNGSVTVTWNVGGTAGAPVNTANVKISYSTDGGLTFPTTLLASTPNDGSQAVTIPAGDTTTARIKVEAIGNIYFDMSDVNFTVSGLATPIGARADFDGDGKTDYSVFRPSDGNWYVNRSTAGFFAVNWGLASDTLIPGDYDGDQKTDTAIWRPSATPGVQDVHILKSNGFVYTAAEFGDPGDIPVFADYDADGKTDYAVYRPGTTTWMVLGSTSGAGNTVFGAAGIIPVTGDFDLDGKSDFTTYNAGSWSTKLSSTGAVQNHSMGGAGGIPVVADYNGDGRDEYAVFNTNGSWQISTAFLPINWGLGTDIPVPGDYDGDGKDDVGVFRNGDWYILQSTAGYTAFHWGLGTDKAVPRAYYAP